MSAFTVPPADSPAGTVPPLPAPEIGPVTIPAPAPTAAPMAPPMVALYDVVHPAPEPAAAPVAVTESPVDTDGIAASVKALAERHGIDLATVTPTGRGRKITRKDVENAIAAQESTALTVPDGVAGDDVAATETTTTTLTLRLALRDGHAVRLSSTEDFLALAREHLPQMQVVEAALELTSGGTVLLAEITTTLEVQL